jgi:precorrin-6Y C5,15-methyltransferase (decarboxylating)
MWVFEQMGTDREKVKRYTLVGAARGKFTSPNLVILKRTAGKKTLAAKLVLGTPDHLFAHERGLITKAEVRTVSLSKLRLEKNHVLWDIGAGSGSVSIEAALFITGGKIFALEKSESRISLIKENLKTFKVTNLKTVLADFPQENLRLPAPDRIFIGGGGRNLKAIIKAGAAELKKNGRMVINTVLIANIETAVKALEQSGFKAEVAQVQVSKSKDMPWSTRLEAQNPVWIITGQREKATT